MRSRPMPFALGSLSLRATLLSLFLLFGSSARLSFGMDDAEVLRIREGLAAHGIASSAQGLASFLEKGWGAGQKTGQLPTIPATKSSLVMEAWQLLGLEHEKILRDPILSFQVAALARRYATGQFPLAIQQIADHDAQNTEPALRDARRTEIREYLQYNGMIALGLFGKPSPDLIEDARKVFYAENRPIIQVAYARTLGLLGDHSALDALAREAAQANHESSVAAAQALDMLLGTSFGITPVTAAAPRRERARELAAWWKEHGSKTKIDREAALARLLQAPPSAPHPQQNLREMLRASADIQDIKNARGSRTAWTLLKDAADREPEVFLKSLDPIARDRQEDLDNREQAIH